MIGQYEEKLVPFRKKFATETENLYKQAKGDTLLLFLINHTSFGVGMTELVSNWIRRSGENCVKTGFKKLGNDLIVHAKHEHGHEKFMISDTKALVNHWNKHHEKKLDADQILRRPPSPGVVAYQELHENYIKSDSPYAQIAIEYEIEKVSVDYGPDLIKYCASQFNPGILANLSFIREHAALDVGHTAYNKNALNTFLVENPSALNNLVDAGALALRTYGQYLTDCMSMAQKMESTVTS